MPGNSLNMVSLSSAQNYSFNLLKPSVYFTYHHVSNSKILHADYIAFMCFVRISEQTAIFALYCINWLGFISAVESVYCAVRTESLNKAVCASSLKG